jgi:hypothetical protein
MCYFEAESNRGVSVLWPHRPTPLTYRWGATGGKFDVQVRR